jgi:hypothetical protein
MCRGDRGGPLLQQASERQPLLLGLNTREAGVGCAAGAPAVRGLLVNFTDNLGSVNFTDPRLQPWICHFASDVWRQYVTRECPGSDTGLVTPGTAVHRDPPPMHTLVSHVLANHSQGHGAAGATAPDSNGGSSSSSGPGAGSSAPSAGGGPQTSGCGASKDVQAQPLLWVTFGLWLLGLVG